MTKKAIKGIPDPRLLEEWLAEQIEQLQLPLKFELIAAGGSNLTYKITDQTGRHLALRRGPLAGHLQTAHDMQREYRVMHALAHFDSGVPVPRCLVFCDDKDLLGAEFYVMQFVEGRILRNSADARDMDKERCNNAMHSLVDVQVAMHKLDIDAAGLSDLSYHRTNYIARQLKRWQKQVSASTDRSLPLLTEIASTLELNNPGDQAEPGLVHGDYRFDNTVLADDDRICAVLDWELCAIGDPVADFFWSLLYWGKSGDSVVFIEDSPTAHPAFAKREAVIAAYSEKSDFDLSKKNYFFAFGYWKMACIVEGVYARLRKGAGGGMKITADLSSLGDTVQCYLNAAATELERI